MECSPRCQQSCFPCFYPLVLLSRTHRRVVHRRGRTPPCPSSTTVNFKRLQAVSHWLPAAIRCRCSACIFRSRPLSARLQYETESWFKRRAPRFSECAPPILRRSLLSHLLGQVYRNAETTLQPVWSAYGACNGIVNKGTLTQTYLFATPTLGLPTTTTVPTAMTYMSKSAAA